MSERMPIPSQRTSDQIINRPQLPEYNLLIANEVPRGREFYLNLAMLKGEFCISERRLIVPYTLSRGEIQSVRNALQKYDPSGEDIFRDPHNHRVPELQQAIVRSLKLSEVALNGVLLFEHSHKNDDPGKPCMGEVITDAVVDYYRHEGTNFGAFYHDMSTQKITRLEQRRDDKAGSDVGNVVRHWSLSKV